ncbi:MAG: hypothetical protein JWM16_2316, partial [Verrucomicrobiales bacterium]|nr:hypothetical protein [Verrucomicrobiales bacterium]
KPRIGALIGPAHLSWETSGEPPQPQRGCVIFEPTGLVPDITFVPGLVVFSEQRAEFVLEGLFLVMGFLSRDVNSNRFEIGSADGKDAITGLP